jgi:hypothetical protein
LKGKIVASIDKGKKAGRPPRSFGVMQQKWGIVLTVVLFVLCGFDEIAGAKESYTDEAGRVIYTIDDDGIVSMFENSPTDLTISVTRGTREQMQPQITDVNPDAIPAGAHAVLRLKGKNLVGATVKMSMAGIEVGAYAGKPGVLDLPVRVSATVPPGEVIVEVTTPIGSTKTSVTIKELQFGSGSAIRNRSEKQIVATSAPTSCPEGMVGVPAERGGYCIDIDRTFRGDVRGAERSCAASGKRLCSASEWQQACVLAAAGKFLLKNMIGAWEWTGSQTLKDTPGSSGADYGGTGDLQSILMGQTDCKTERTYQTWRNENIAGRCCK